ncbi:MAG: DUF2066 domain-containing protein [Granulosicoccus sp.]|nr:DUF2066 domain-containing protein [Granulosicoccus sp.]
MALVGEPEYGYYMVTITKRWKLHSFCLIWLLLMGFFAGTAAAQSDAYSVEVAVADKSDSEQKDAFQLALRRVLRNNSGDKTVLNRDIVRQELTQAVNYVKGFTYRTPPAGTVISSDTPITDRVRQTGQATQLMLISFERAMVGDLIDSSAPARADQTEEGDEGEQPVAVPRSNSALVWLLIQDDGRDILISDPAAVNVQRRSREIAGATGISLAYPVGDTEDQLALTIDDMLNADVDRLLAASERYGQPHILLGTLSRGSAQAWRGRWLRVLGTDVQQSEFETQTLDEALKQGLQVLSSVASIDESYRYGGESQSGTEALILVGSVTSTEDYARLMNFLQGQSAVSTVYPKEITETSVLFSVVPRSAIAQISAASANESWLIQSVAPVSGPSSNLSDSPARNADLTLELNR